MLKTYPTGIKLQQLLGAAFSSSLHHPPSFLHLALAHISLHPHPHFSPYTNIQQQGRVESKWRLNTTSSMCLNYRLSHPRGKHNRKSGMRGIWAESLTLPWRRQPVGSSSTRLSGTATRQQERRGSGTGTHSRGSREGALRSTYSQCWTPRAEVQLKGENTEPQNSDIKTPYPSRATPALWAASSLGST